MANNGDYIGAVQKISEASAIIGEDSDLSAKSQKYEDSYVSASESEAETYLNADDYTSAESIITNYLLFRNNIKYRFFSAPQAVKNVGLKG